ncbi:MAG: hypothetical protein UX04_C0001G0092 [Microgenomates group bacterium GW2011_GWF2_45_18]|nr:MAG: hypothetical protein UW18_C0003G0138 [Microgenomates group bacterium GW2011_GWF1_44_10]KKU02321.1 MAG: hypothetical protein UX04_C0001G0092 [Microgenomates group bacterium GW2011_GWF2_45_18]OGJ41656.1 MAG: hypothetical protein A2378_02105 [Candidatus Pacebacteria bacterium RIFOXYB1_FULL_44_10]HAU99213.1 hypothetical protein [Candidatus Paceibacterota bacterium]HAX01744.1 hypothetical protein [Candidatus Paceibacterota bacterium]
MSTTTAKLFVKTPDGHLGKAAVYDRWFHTLGGGEKHAFGFAEALRDMGYSVELLCHQQFSIDEAEKKLGVDLSNMSIKILPNRVDKELSEYTRPYDLFLSCSIFDVIPSLAKKSVLSVFFPFDMRYSWKRRLKLRVLVPFLRKIMQFSTIFERVSEKNGKKFLESGARICFSVDSASIELAVQFESYAFSLVDSVRFFVGEDEIFFESRTTNIHTNTTTYHFIDLRGLHEKGVRIEFDSSSPYARGVMLQSARVRSFGGALYYIFKWLNPVWEMRLHGGETFTTKQELQSYQLIVGNSAYTTRWIKTYWGVDARVLYPPVDISRFSPATQKKNQIVHIGRFFTAGHSKKQLELVRLFRQCVSDGLKDWELHLIGSVANGDVNRAYFEQVVAEASGLPVVIHENATSEELIEVLNHSKIYWHATGFGEDMNENPERMEHFGISTVEAMSAGCVPVVFDAGAQSEIVSEDCGVVWKTAEEAIRATVTLSKDEKLWKMMSDYSIERAKMFAEQHFVEKFRGLLESGLTKNRE